nr:hypothetical protein [Thiobacillus sp.]
MANDFGAGGCEPLSARLDDLCPQQLQPRGCCEDDFGSWRARSLVSMARRVSLAMVGNDGVASITRPAVSPQWGHTAGASRLSMRRITSNVPQSGQ